MLGNKCHKKVHNEKEKKHNGFTLSWICINFPHCFYKFSERYRLPAIYRFAKFIPAIIVASIK